MECFFLKIDAKWVAERINLTLSEIRYALDRGWMQCRDVINLAESNAMSVCATEDQEIIDQLALILSEDAETVNEILPRASTNELDIEAPAVWQYLWTAWIVENADRLPDPWDIFLGAFAALGSPEQMYPLLERESGASVFPEPEVRRWRSYAEDLRSIVIGQRPL
ncbi:hypothetical protein [Cellulomonas sp. NPDC089187]|uniref:hypothetical protein n=1 Tax=Cellulomonas sp. NPDC089187 TaxID=3154970 RepID=UPI00342CE47B